MKINFKILIILFSIFYFLFSVIDFVSASETNGTIVSGGNNGYAWSDRAGWVNFGCSGCGISVADSGITGHAWNGNYGWINMAPTNGGVSVSVAGAFSGSAWGSGVSWINFSGVSINSSGRFVGQATGSIIGTLTFDCTNCSVTTDFRPQNFRTIVSTPTTVVSGGGGGSGISANIPPQINSYNFPLTILPGQSGSIEQAVSSGRKVTIDVPRNIFPKKITITISENPLVEGVNSALLPQNIDLINSAFYDIAARDENSNFVKSFSDYLTITLPIPFELRSFSDVGVYWLDEAAEQWKRVADASFSESNAAASFRVNHLTKFGIFRVVDGLKEQLSIPFASEIIKEILDGKTLEEALSKTLETTEGVVVPAIPEVGEGAPSATGEEASGEVVPEDIAPGEGTVAELPAQLFDINVEIENEKITNIKDLVARVIFTSFGRVPTPVDLTFDILNKNGDKIYSKMDKVTVRTQEVLTERFKDVEDILAAGKYTLLITTVYNRDVKDEFRQDFEIVEVGQVKTPFWNSIWFWIISTLCLLVIFALIIKKLSSDDDEQEHTIG